MDSKIQSILDKLYWFYNLDLTDKETSEEYIKTLNNLKKELE